MFILRQCLVLRSSFRSKLILMCDLDLLALALRCSGGNYQLPIWISFWGSSVKASVFGILCRSGLIEYWPLGKGNAL